MHREGGRTSIFPFLLQREDNVGVTMMDRVENRIEGEGKLCDTQEKKILFEVSVDYKCIRSHVTYLMFKMRFDDILIYLMYLLAL